MPPKPQTLYTVVVERPGEDAGRWVAPRTWSRLSSALSSLREQRAAAGRQETVRFYKAEVVWVEVDDDCNPIEQPEPPVRRDDRGLLGDALGSLD